MHSVFYTVCSFWMPSVEAIDMILSVNDGSKIIYLEVELVGLKEWKDQKVKEVRSMRAGKSCKMCW